MKNINIVLFDDFTLLDAFGPADVLNRLSNHFSIDFYSLNGGKIRASQNLQIDTKPFDKIICNDILLVPGGFGTRQLVNDPPFIKKLQELSEKSEYVLTVCTGSALLAKTGLLKNIKATSNKMAFDWVIQQDPDVQWIRKARWVVDGKYYSSSGVTAGMDMALAFIKDQFSLETAAKIAQSLEYRWNQNPDDDEFASQQKAAIDKNQDVNHGDQ